MNISLLSQKGGVTKSTWARFLAVLFAKAGNKVLLADMDVEQGTSYEWYLRRTEYDTKPYIEVKQFHTVDQVLCLEQEYDLIVFDGKAFSNKQTLEIAKVSDLIILPTGTSFDDMNPQIRLAHEFVKHNIERDRILFTLSRTRTSKAAIEYAKNYIGQTEYVLLDGYIPDKEGYSMAMNRGLSVAETSFSTLNRKVIELGKNIYTEINKIQVA